MNILAAIRQYVRQEYVYRTDRVRLELDQKLSTDTFKYYSWYVYYANEWTKSWDVIPLNVMGYNHWSLVSINSIKQSDGAEEHYATFMRLK